jgi:hypothetical protein
MRLLAIAVLLVGLQASATADDPKPSAEMKVLEDLIGTWDEATTTKPCEWVPKGGTSTAVTKRTWALGGKVIRAEGVWMPAKTEYLHLISYDAGAKTYRSWYFDSEGTAPNSVSKGTWDEKTRTVSYTDTDAAGNKAVNTHKIKDKDNSEWKLVITSPTGAVLLDMQGKCTRRKE